MSLGPAVPLVLAALGYALAFRAMRRGRRPPAGRVLAYMLGLAALGVALASPLESLSGALFSAHMVQHMVLTVVAPPLVALGWPLHVLLAALPVGWVRAAGRWVVRPGWPRAALRLVTHPFALALALNVPLVAWHLPRAYEAALGSRPLHDLEHLTFLLPSVAFWLLMLEPTVPRASRPTAEGALLVLFATWMVCDLLGATLALSDRALYTAYADTERWGLSARADQQLGGLVMWIGGGVFYGVAMLATLARAVQAGRTAARPDARS